MGTDLDFALELRKNKLVSTQFQQPTNQLQAITQPTQQPNAEFLLHLMRMLEQRFGNRVGDDSDGPVAVVIQLGDNQRIIIAFPNRERVRVPEPVRERPFERLMMEIMEDGNDRVEEEEVRELRPHRISQPVREVFEPQRQRMTQIPQMIPEVQYQDGDWDLNIDFPRRHNQELQQLQRNPRQSLQPTISSRSLPHQDQLRHSEDVVQNVKEQLQKQKRQQQLRKKDDNNRMGEEHEVEENPQSKQQFQPRNHNLNHRQRNQASLNDMKNTLDQTFVPLNQNLINQVNNSRRTQELSLEGEVTCWQAFVRMISNIFRLRSS